MWTQVYAQLHNYCINITTRANSTVPAFLTRRLRLTRNTIPVRPCFDGKPNTYAAALLPLGVQVSQLAAMHHHDAMASVCPITTIAWHFEQGS